MHFIDYGSDSDSDSVNSNNVEFADQKRNLIADTEIEDTKSEHNIQLETYGSPVIALNLQEIVEKRQSICLSYIEDIPPKSKEKVNPLLIERVNQYIQQQIDITEVIV